MNDTPTPRTDALMPDQGHKRTIYDHIQVMETHARQLERELADMTKQRDSLAEALRTSSERFRNPKYGCMWDDAADDIDKTLSAVKGGKP